MPVLDPSTTDSISSTLSSVSLSSTTADANDAALSSSTANVCHTCKNSIATTQFIRVGTYKFHKEHFVCVVCSKSLHNMKFHLKDSQFYCSEDYIDRFRHTCKSCNQKITSGSIVQTYKSYYHPEHFICVSCKTPFKNGKYYEYEKEPYCEDHYFAIAGEKCEHCSKPVRDNDVIRVHNKVYHTGCLSVFSM
jgi:uncharacterized CHY-type Zn-finger protein